MPNAVSNLSKRYSTEELLGYFVSHFGKLIFQIRWKKEYIAYVSYYYQKKKYSVKHVDVKI